MRLFIEMDTTEDCLKVYVSRLPFQWNDEHLKSHFQACFGSVISASVVKDKSKGQPLGFGYVVFSTEEARTAALNQGSIHAKKRNIKISAVERSSVEEDSAASSVVCYLWQRFQCVKGESCKFKHECPGKCIEVSLPGEGKTKKCLSFKSKGKCSKGEACPFLHIFTKSSEGLAPKSTAAVVPSVPAGVGAVDSAAAPAPSHEKGICNKFRRGKCRKGDACIFAHVTAIPAAAPVDTPDLSPEPSAPGKRKITGAFLVQQRKRALLEGHLPA